MWPQKPRKRRLFGAVAAVTTVALVVSACDLNLAVSGSVRGPSGKPLPDVAVTLRTPGRQPHVTHTSADGSFDVGMVGADPEAASVYFEKVGFVPLARGLAGEARPTLHVVLVPEQ
jgi:hypothetical protein